MVSYDPGDWKGTTYTGQCSDTPCMTGGAIIVDTGNRTICGLGAIISLMLVLVVTEVLRRSDFMLAIGRSHRPGNLDRQNNQQENGEPATHRVNGNRTKVHSKTPQRT